MSPSFTFYYEQVIGKEINSYYAMKRQIMMCNQIMKIQMKMHQKITSDNDSCEQQIGMKQNHGERLPFVCVIH